MTYRLLIPRTFPRWLAHRVSQGIALALGAACLMLGFGLLTWGFFLSIEAIP